MSRPFDVSNKDLVDLSPTGWLHIIGCPRDPRLVKAIDTDLSTVVPTVTDKLIEVSDPEGRWLLMLEFHAYWAGKLPYEMQRRNSLARFKHGLPVASVAILLKREADSPAMTGTLHMPDPLGPPSTFHYRVVRIWEVPAEQFLTGPIGLVPFVPLANLANTDQERLKRTMERRIQREAKGEQARALRESLAILLTISYDKVGIEAWRDLMNGLDISNTPLVNEWLQQGEAKGKIEGRIEGKIEGRIEGKLEGKIETLLGLGKRRFRSVPVKVRQQIKATRDPALLDAMLERILDAKSWQEVLNG